MALYAGKEIGPYIAVAKLGSGAYGEVWKGSDTLNASKTIAIKRTIGIFHGVLQKNDDAVKTLRELRMLKRLRRNIGDNDNPGPTHICSLINLLSPVIAAAPQRYQNRLIPGSVEHTTLFLRLGDFFLIFELMDTDLQKKMIGPKLSIDDAISIMYQLLLGLKYIHSANVIHRDLKPANILISPWKEEFDEDPRFAHLKILGTNLVASIADFGFARAVEPSDMLNAEPPLEISPEIHGMDACIEVGVIDPTCSTTTAVGGGGADAGFEPVEAPLPRSYTQHVLTRYYRAPEVILCEHYNSAVDVWSLGCILVELMGSVEGNTTIKSLFRGQPCGSLSSPRGGSWAPEVPILEDDGECMLSVIFDVIGKPTPEELSRLKNPAISAQLAQFQDRVPEDLCLRYAEAAKTTPDGQPTPKAQKLMEAVELAMQMLRFDPLKRITAEDALKHPLFAALYDADVVARSCVDRPMVVAEEATLETRDELFNSIVREVMSYCEVPPTAPCIATTAESPSPPPPASPSHIGTI